jgi:hypothetical protein
VIEFNRVITELKPITMEIRTAIRIRCPDCREAVYVPNGGDIPIFCTSCHKWYGYGRQPIVEVDLGKA